MSKRKILHSSLIFSSLLFLTACAQPVTNAPKASPEEIAEEQARHSAMIAQADQKGGAPKQWKNKRGMRPQFEAVGARIEAAGADVCRDMGLPDKGQECYFFFDLQDKDEINAYADGENVIVTHGMMRFIANDDELAMILGHELAHNLLRHQKAASENAIVGGVLGFALDVALASAGGGGGSTFTRLGADVGALSYSPSFEREADYVGLYIAARAGYDVEKGSAFWRRLSVQEPDTSYGSMSHPSNPERFVALHKTVQEIRARKREKEPLVPSARADTDS